MKDLWNYLKETTKPIVLYGMGNGADKIISVLNKYDIKISGVFASDGFVRQKVFHGFNVTDYKTAKQNFGDMIVLVCFGTALPDVIGNIKRIASEQELYAPDVPVYGDTLFDMQYVSDNKKQLEQVYNRLADDVSKNVFKNVVMYKLTGKINYLFDCETPSDEVYEKILKFNDSETYFDLGAYRGDTVAEFLANAHKYDKIVAVEPDFKTYNKLCVATQNIKDIININACVSDKDGQIAFDMHGSRGSNIGEGSNIINSVTIDALSRDDTPTYIKMDIEGAEASAIVGGTDTIRRYKPKMQIAAYHRSEDLILIPEKVLNLRIDYEIYIRHFPCLPCWDMSYYFI
ncbi:MAG: FkbM family methyltransferase [Clostridia bacterium]|nr:FkbM family methyltransferase [Clostridia bacterium]